MKRTRYDVLLEQLNDIEGMLDFLWCETEDTCQFCKYYYEFEKIAKNYIDLTAFCQFKCREGIKERLLEGVENEN